jgi:hypothetical protein
MKASHNSLTGYPLLNWWLKPIHFFGKCQDKDIFDQWAKGVRYFDLRVTDHKGKLIGSHGIFKYNVTLEDALNSIEFNAICDGEDAYVRIILEDTFFKGCSTSEFVDRIEKTRSRYRVSIHRIGLKSDWSNHKICNDVDFLGCNDWSIFDYKNKIAEMERMTIYGEHFASSTPFVYECYTYKLAFPRLTNWLIRKFIPNNSMSDFV